MAKGSETRIRILDIAESAVLSKGFGNTSIEEIVAAADITKSGFFYHFPDKNALARALIVRYIETEDAILDNLEQRARELTDDPLQAFLVALKLFAELLYDLPNGHPGCLVASAAYQERLFDREVRALTQEAMLSWRARFKAALEDIVAIYPLQDDVSLDDVADMATSAVEGGIILSKSLEDPKAVARQILLYRSYIKLLFQQTTH